MDSIQGTDERFMRRAIEVALGNPTAPFGAVIIERESHRELAFGLNASRRNPVLHGEIAAINNLVERVPSPDYQNLCLYTTAEPCPMCLSAILWAGFSRIVYGTSVDTLSAQGWKQFQLRSKTVIRSFPDSQCEIVGRVLEPDCDQLFRTATSKK